MHARPTFLHPILAITVVAAAACGGSVDVGGSGGSGGSGGGSSGIGGSAATGGTTGSVATGTSTGTGVSPPAGQCKTDADCFGSPCVPVTPGGYTICLYHPPEATMCAPPGAPFMDECCTSADCMVGKCYSSLTIPYCGGPAMAEYNRCIWDDCTSDFDCGDVFPSPVCLPAGAWGKPTRSCFPAYCHTNADCVDESNGICAPVNAPCCNVPAGLACVYPGGCQNDTDCASDGSKHCEIEASSKRGVCVNGPAACPA